MPCRSFRFPRLAGCCVLLISALAAHGQGRTAANHPATTGTAVVQPVRKQRPASELIAKQEPPKITPRVLEKTTPDNSSIIVSISKQRAYLMCGGEIAIDTPISSGKAAGMTPTGKFAVQEKDKDHRSSVYGNFVNRKGQVVRSGVSTRIDSAPSGTHYVGAPMWYFLRLNGAIGMHVGILPGYPASHGCIRLPAEIAPLFYERAKIGTPAEIVN